MYVHVYVLVCVCITYVVGTLTVRIKYLTDHMRRNRKVCA